MVKPGIRHGKYTHHNPLDTWNQCRVNCRNEISSSPDDHTIKEMAEAWKDANVAKDPDQNKYNYTPFPATIIVLKILINSSQHSLNTCIIAEVLVFSSVSGLLK